MGRDDVKSGITAMTLRVDRAMFFLPTPPKPILTPCIGICTLALDGLCVGCHRTGDEIARWSQFDDVERARYINEILPERESTRAPLP